MIVQMSSLASRRIDHLILEVPDIQATLNDFLSAGHLEAWPIGPFWPNAITAGFSAASLNIELVQPAEAHRQPNWTTIVLEPTSLEAAANKLDSLGIPYRMFEKIESNPALLMARGFTQVNTPQLICANLIPESNDLPFRFFFCEYAPFLKQWLSPNHPRFAGTRQVTTILWHAEEPNEAHNLFEALTEGSCNVEFTSEPTSVLFAGT
jgi:hypothetical protein